MPAARVESGERRRRNAARRTGRADGRKAKVGLGPKRTLAKTKYR